LELSVRGQGYGRLFAAAQSRPEGQHPGGFRGHIDSFEDVETVLDEVVDGIQEAAVVDRLGLEVYRGKPECFDESRNHWQKDDLDYHLLRASMVLIFLLFGSQKWFEYEAHLHAQKYRGGPRSRFQLARRPARIG
jgi:hypothetical protein